MAHVKYFANNKDRMSLTDKVIESMLLLANTVESQLEEVKQMERLTQRENDKLILVKQDNGEYIPAYWDEDNFKAIKKLSTYEDLEEQGLLVRLLCKVGDTVYVPTRNFVSELRITMVSVDMHGAYFSWMLNSGIYPNLDGFSKSKLGKTVFLTREEAEKKLEEMKAND